MGEMNRVLPILEGRGQARVEVAADGHSGNRSTEGRRVVAVDVGGTSMKGALVDVRGRLESAQRRATPRGDGPHTVIDRVLRFVQELVDRCREMHGEDAVARRVWDEAIAALGRGIANYAVLLDPERVLIGGGMAEAGDILLEPLRARVAEGMPFGDPPGILPADLGEDAGCIGAAFNAWRTLGVEYPRPGVGAAPLPPGLCWTRWRSRSNRSPRGYRAGTGARLHARR